MKHERFEQLGGGVQVCVSRAHTFGSDAVLLADFAAPKPRERCIDLCSGCGIIPLLWLSKPDSPREITALDIQPEAIRQMQRSIERSGLGGNLRPVLADLRKPSKPDHAAYDLVTCNPPYRALGTGFISDAACDQTARHEVECSLEEVCRAGAYLLRYGGRFCICHLPERLVDVLALMRKYAVEPKRIRFVQQRIDTAPWLVLAEGKRGAKPFAVIEPPVIVEHSAVRFN